MKAARYYSYGPPEVVKVEEVQKPVPGKNEILIKVQASTVNRTDCGFRSAEYFIVRFFSGLFAPKNKVLGCEFSGTIEAIGEDVTLYSVGEKLFGFNDAKFGGHAEYKIADEKDAMATVPANISLTEAAAIAEGAHYALCNIRAAKVKAGQEVLVNGATGAIGSAAIQLLKYFGARVTTVCKTGHIPIATALGADEVVDYSRQDFTKMFNQKFDFVFDSVGKSSYGKCKPIMTDKGVYISTELGYLSQNPFLAIMGLFSKGKKVMFPLPAITKNDVDFLRELVENGKLRPLIDRTYSLHEIVDAYRYVETGQKIGNVLLRVE